MLIAEMHTGGSTAAGCERPPPCRRLPASQAIFAEGVAPHRRRLWEPQGGPGSTCCSQERRRSACSLVAALPAAQGAHSMRSASRSVPRRLPSMELILNPKGDSVRLHC